MSSAFGRGLLLLLAGIVMTIGAARGAEIMNFHWKGNDLILRFSDSVSWKVDLAESDTSQLVVRISGVTPGTPLTIGGPKDRQAILTEVGPNQLRLTVRRNGKLGYASVWRPYSHMLVVHTFSWDGLNYPQQQYYKGLLAIEQGLDVQATELLQVAGSTGERRASSVLGVYYARRGDFAKAAPYLKRPADADDYAALAAVQTNAGDNAGAESSMKSYEKMIAEMGSDTPRPSEPLAERPERFERRGGSGPVVDEETDGDNAADHGFDTNDDLRSRASRKWLYLGGGVLALLLLILLVIWLSRRSSSRPAPPYSDDRAGGPRPAPDFDDGLRTMQAQNGSRGPNARAAAAATAQPVEATVVESRPHVIVPEAAAPEPVAVEKMSAESVAADTIVPETPVVEKPAVEKQVVEKPAVERPATEETPASAHASATEVMNGDATFGQEEGTAEAPAPRSAPRQAADLRRRIEMMRTSAPATPAPRNVTFNPSESTVDEARRLQISRDSVELRRRMEERRG